MHVLLRRGASALLAVGLLAGATAPAVAGYPEEWEPLIFELTLSGEVDPADTFAVTHSCRDGERIPECNFIHRYSWAFCSGDAGYRQDYDAPVCEAGTYRMELARPAGVTIDYSLARFVGSSAPTHMLPGSVTIPVGGVTLRLGYDYSLSTRPPTLPDTAIGTPGPGGGMADVPAIPMGLALMLVGLAIISLAQPTATKHQAYPRRVKP